MGALSQLHRTHNGNAVSLPPMPAVNHMPAAHRHRQRQKKKPHGRPFKTRSYNAAGKTAQTRRAVDTVSGSGMAAHPCRPLHKDKKKTSGYSTACLFVGEPAYFILRRL